MVIDIHPALAAFICACTFYVALKLVTRRFP